MRSDYREKRPNLLEIVFCDRAHCDNINSVSFIYKRHVTRKNGTYGSGMNQMSETMGKIVPSFRIFEQLQCVTRLHSHVSPEIFLPGREIVRPWHWSGRC